MANNLETLLESRMLDDLSPDLIKQLAEFIRTRQAEKLPLTRSNRLVNEAMETHAEWLSLQDIPQLIIPRHKARPFHPSPRLSPVGSSKLKTRESASQPTTPLTKTPVLGTNSPVARPATTVTTTGEDIFTMDESEGIPALSLDDSRPSPSFYDVPSSATPPSSAAPWKGRISQVSSR